MKHDAAAGAPPPGPPTQPCRGAPACSPCVCRAMKSCILYTLPMRRPISAVSPGARMRLLRRPMRITSPRFTRSVGAKGYTAAPVALSSPHMRVVNSASVQTRFVGPCAHARHHRARPCWRRQARAGPGSCRWSTCGLGGRHAAAAAGGGAHVKLHRLERQVDRVPARRARHRRVPRVVLLRARGTPVRQLARGGGLPTHCAVAPTAPRVQLPRHRGRAPGRCPRRT